MTDIAENLRDYANDDHERLCQGRTYSCSCGYDDKRDPLIAEAADLITALRAEVEWYKEHSARVQEVTATYTRTIMQYRAENARLTARIRELEEALGFYANPANRRDGRFEHQVDPDNGHNVLVSIPSSYIKDGGKRATAALKGETNGN